MDILSCSLGLLYTRLVADSLLLDRNPFIFAGMGINWHSDSVIRHLRAPGDTRHYLPQRGMYRYVTSANYLGEIVEWVGWAILTWSLSGCIFAWWTVANLVPRADAIWHRYREEFGTQVGLKKRIFPFLY